MQSEENKTRVRELCLRCLRPRANCYCKYTAPVNTGVKFVFLMHPKEAKRQRTGTGRLAHLCLPQSEILVGVDFTQNARLNSLLSSAEYFPVLLYPADVALTCASAAFKERLSGKTLLPVIIDATWFCSKKIIRLSENLGALPRLTFKRRYSSLYTFKREPKDSFISTIESCYYLIQELKEERLAARDADPEPLMRVFKAMVRFQLAMENERIRGNLPNTHPKDFKYTTLKTIPDF